MAEAAMHRARETGGNHVVEHSDSIETERQARIAMQADIRRGLEADEFDIDYQPIFDFKTQAMLGVEALLRWRRRAGGPMGPGDFIPAAEASGLIEDLGMFALRRACRDLARYPSLKLSVNISTVQFRNPMLASQIDQVLAATSFPPHRLQLEITESFLLTRPERAKAALDELRARGILIALDDFGTGFSSIGYLRQFEFDRVKLDRSLVDELDLDPVKFALVESTMIFAFAMGLAITAEGVERREEAAALSRLGCHEFQGFLFSRPLPLAGLARLMDQAAASAKKAG
jgi:EAL domain-containing protein (putative c-di-GMP-specific phosphodiesterase class I)